ncbi:MAG: hypothetical protein ACREKM_08285 [Longimicrobiales bacterium]
MCWKLLLAIATLAACQGGPAGIDDVVGGTLHWTGSVGGIGGWQHTPASAGYTVRLELDNDGSVSAFRNDSLVATSHISMREPAARYGSADDYDVTFDPPLHVFPFATMETSTVRTPEAGTIVFADPCCDMYSHTFETQP